MRNNITLIGMPASGKSTMGVLLAKVLGYQFVDGDILIQEKYGMLLREIIDEMGLDGFIKIEEEVNLSLNLNKAIISPGGSIVYSKRAMKHLKKISTVVYIKLPYETIKRRVGNVKRRGVVLKEGQTLKDLYDERIRLYEKYCHFSIEADGLSVEDLLDTLVLALKYNECVDRKNFTEQ